MEISNNKNENETAVLGFAYTASGAKMEKNPKYLTSSDDYIIDDGGIKQDKIIIDDGFTGGVKKDDLFLA